MPNPQISIIVPVYKAEQYLPRCICSILTQTFTDFELLLIDDGSPDNSGAICDEYALKDKRIRVFHKKNGGVSSARNLGLDNSRGEWIYFADSDDELIKDGLQILFDGVKNGARFVLAGYEKYDETGCLIYSCNNLKQKTLDNNESILYMFKPIDYEYHGYLWCKLFHAQTIKSQSLRFNEEIYFNEDRLFIVQYLCHNNMRCFYTTKPVYKYFIHKNSAMASIEQSFNYNLITDLRAFVLILNEVKTTKNYKNLYWVKRKLYFSSLRIKGLARKLGMYDKKIIEEICDIVNENIPMIYHLHFIFVRIKNKIKRIFNYNYDVLRLSCSRFRSLWSRFCP